ncbi:L-asparagine transporter-like permease [Paenibacillus sp. PastF-3]|nr:L-asparagine transporter-like permease [Paenibacillus sp. PastF-3]
MGFMAMDLRDPKEAPKAGRFMLLGVTLLYVLSIGLALLFVSPEKVRPDQSSIIAALEAMELPILVYVLNGVMIVAGFSILVASLYAVSTMLVTLAEDKDAPSWLAVTKGKRKMPLYALGINMLGLCVTIVLSLFLPKQIFEHVTTAAGLVILYTWLFILASFLKLLKLKMGGWIRSMVAMALIIAAVAGTLFEKGGRPGFWSSLLIICVVALITWFREHLLKKREQTS